MYDLKRNKLEIKKNKIGRRFERIERRIKRIYGDNYSLSFQQCAGFII